MKIINIKNTIELERTERTRHTFPFFDWPSLDLDFLDLVSLDFLDLISLDLDLTTATEPEEEANFGRGGSFGILN